MMRCVRKHKERRQERIMMAEAGAEQASVELHSLPSEPDCFGSTVTCYSEGSAAMDMCVKTEPDEEDISQPAYCTEVQGFSAEEMDSGLHLDTERIKTETVMVKIMDINGNLQPCKITEELCPPSQRLNSSIGLLSTQCKLETGEVKVKQHSQVQEHSGAEKKVNKTADHAIKEEYADIQVHELSSVSCILARQCKLEIDEVKLESHFQLGRSSGVETAVKEHQFVVASKKQYKCSHCGKVFLSRSSFKRHQCVHTGEKPYVCIECGKRFSRSGNLKQHWRVHSGEKLYTCCECGKGFSRAGNLKEHQRVHSGEKPYTCSECGRSYSRACRLKEHQYVHSDEKPYKCSDCGKSFSYGSHFKQHKLTHSPENPYKCDQCGKTFSCGNALKLHQRIHSGEKPYKCSECEASFTQAGNLKLHQRVHSGEKPYICSECGKSFYTASYLEEHQRVHTGEKPYKCKDCGKSFASRKYLKYHERKHGRI